MTQALGYIIAIVALVLILATVVALLHSRKIKAERKKAAEESARREREFHASLEETRRRERAKDRAQRLNTTNKPARADADTVNKLVRDIAGTTESLRTNQKPSPAPMRNRSKSSGTYQSPAPFYVTRVHNGVSEYGYWDNSGVWIAAALLADSSDTPTYAVEAPAADVPDTTSFSGGDSGSFDPAPDSTPSYTPDPTPSYDPSPSYDSGSSYSSSSYDSGSSSSYDSGSSSSFDSGSSFGGGDSGSF